MRDSVALAHGRPTRGCAAEPSWVWLHSGGAQLMLAQASDPIDPQQQAVLFYVYVDDAEAFRSKLLESGVRWAHHASLLRTEGRVPRDRPRWVCSDDQPRMSAH